MKIVAELSAVESLEVDKLSGDISIIAESNIVELELGNIKARIIEIETLGKDMSFKINASDYEYIKVIKGSLTIIYNDGI